MNVSLILCSKNGGKRLKRCLSYVENIKTEHDVDLVLVDNGSSDGSFSVMQSFAENAPSARSSIQVLKPGNSAGRNAGIQLVRGDIIIFIDDDCYVDSDFVNQWVKVFQEHEIGFASGMVIPFDVEQDMLGCRTTPDVELLDVGDAVPRGMIQGSNMAFRGECLAAAGLFDERFGAGTRLAGEEWDVAIRAANAGWRGAYFPGPKVWHDHGRVGLNAQSRDNFYCFGGGAVYLKSLIFKFNFRLLRLYYRELKACGWMARFNFLSGSAYYIFLNVTRGSSGRSGA